MNYDFNKDLEDGHEREKLVREDLESLGARFIKDNGDNRYDLAMQMGKKVLTFEIKTDFLCKPKKDTGNFFIEYECRGKPSGINVTESIVTAFVMFHLNQIWYIQTDRIVDAVDRGGLKSVEYNDSNTKYWLIPRKRFEDEALIREITPKNTQTLNREE